MTRIEWSGKAEKQLRRIAADAVRTIILAVRELALWPDCRNVKALVGREGYRLRVGRYRVLFTVREGELRIIRIEEVKKRDERTY
ncbi:MAG: type II toxin-antitoxin system RelE/ParE family toxin [Desulfovibrionaceae bacterium]|nr:type II toxin-antitoxin system RelE/ParE family toxin [Desulfovibrionaceae bacterium]